MNGNKVRNMWTVFHKLIVNKSVHLSDKNIGNFLPRALILIYRLVTHQLYVFQISVL